MRNWNLYLPTPQSDLNQHCTCRCVRLQYTEYSVQILKETGNVVYLEREVVIVGGERDETCERDKAERWSFLEGVCHKRQVRSARRRCTPGCEKKREDIHIYVDAVGSLSTVPGSTSLQVLYLPPMSAQILQPISIK